MRTSVLLTAEEGAVCARLANGGVLLTAATVGSARRLGVHLFLAASLDVRERAQPWAERLLRELRTTAVFYERRERILRRALEVLAAGAVEVLILKGAGLAYTAYSAPYLRPRVDIDLLVAREALDRAERLLAADGWVRDIEPGAELAAAQRHYTKPLGIRADAEYLDLHWRVVNPIAFAHALSFDELRSRAVPVPILGPAARTLAAGDALFLACLHLGVHHPAEGANGITRQLVWLLDIHLLAQLLDGVERERFLAIATRRGMTGMCRRGLESAVHCFGTPAAASLIADLPASMGGELSEQPASPMARLRADLAALPSWRQRARLLREHLFPSMAYIQSKYPTWPSVLLPIASVHRIISGAPKWFRANYH